MRNPSLSIGLVLSCLLLTAAPAHAARLSQPAQAWLDVANATDATIRWSPVAGASSYDIHRNGTAIGSVAGTGALLNDLSPATYAQYQVVARGPGADPSIPSDPVPVTTQAPSGCTHYVSSASGSDAAEGSSGAPWRTIGRLVDAWEPGWVGCVDGSFVEDVSIFRGGTTTSKVVLRSRPGTRATLRGRLWIARGADNVVVAGMRLDGRALADTDRRSLPSPTINSSGAMLLGNDISNARTRVCVLLGSIRGYGSAIAPVLAYNRIHDCGRRGSNTHHGIYVESARRARIVHNAIFDNADRGIQLYPDAQGSLIAANLIDANGTGLIFSGAEGYASSRNVVLRNVISNSQLRSNLEHYWEQPRRPGVGNVAARNCLGGARQGNLALPVLGYVTRANTAGTLVFRSRAADDLRLAPGSGCSQLLRSRSLPLAPFA